MATKSRQFREVQAAEPFKWQNLGESVEGVYSGSREVKREDGTVGILYELTPDNGGAPIGVWGTAYLNTRLDKVDPGTYVRITFVSEQPAKKTGQSPMRIFKVEVA